MEKSSNRNLPIFSFSLLYLLQEKFLTLFGDSSVYGEIVDVKYTNQSVKLFVTHNTSKRVLIFDKKSNLVSTLLEYYTAETYEDLQGNKLLREDKLYKIPKTNSLITKLRYNLELYMLTISISISKVFEKIQSVILIINSIFIPLTLGVYFLQYKYKDFKLVFVIFGFYAILQYLLFSLTLSKHMHFTGTTIQPVRSYRYIGS